MLFVSLPNAVTQGDCKINGHDCDFEIRGTEFRFRRKDVKKPWDVRQILHVNVGEELTSYSCSSEQDGSKVDDLREWGKKQVRDYRAGRLTKRQILYLEELPGWAWDEATVDAHLRE